MSPRDISVASQHQCLAGIISLEHYNKGFPLSKAIIHNEKYTMEISGQIGVNPETNELEPDIEKQTDRAIKIIKEILENEGWNLSNIIKTRIYLVDMKDYTKVNEIYSKYFSKDYPTSGQSG